MLKSQPLLAGSVDPTVWCLQYEVLLQPGRFRKSILSCFAFLTVADEKIKHFFMNYAAAQPRSPSFLSNI